MLEGLVAGLLNRFLGMYVNNFDPKQLKVGIWSGDTKASLLFEEIGLVLDDDQYRDGLMMVDLFHYFIRHQEYKKLQPKGVTPKEDPRAWFKFAGDAILSKIHERNRRWSWEYFRERRDDRKRYIELFKKRKQQQQFSAEDSADIEALERRLDYEDLRFWRSLGRNQLKKENAAALKSKPAQPQQQGWLAWAWGSKPAEEQHSDMEENTQITEEQKRELYDAIDWDEKTALAESVDVPRDSVKIQVEASLSTGSFTLKKNHNGKLKDLISLHFDDEDVLGKPRGVDAPYRIRNYTGFEAVVQSKSTVTDEVTTTRLEDGQQVPWSFEPWEKMRENLLAESSSNDVTIQLEGSGFDPVKSVRLNREGEFIYCLRPKTDTVLHRLLVEVSLGQDNVKYVTLRSPLVVENDTQIPVELGVYDAEEGHLLKIEKISPGESRPAPVGAVFLKSLLIRPDSGFGYAWSSETLWWRDLLKRPTRTMVCKGENGDPFYFQVNATFDKANPLTRFRRPSSSKICSLTVRKPLEGAEQEGAMGFFKGIGKGVVGFATKPAIGVLDMASNVSEGIRNTTTVFDGSELERVRYARFISADGIVRPYNGRESMGQNWLKQVDNGKYFNEQYIAHLELPREDMVVMVTYSRILLIRSRRLTSEWDVPLKDVQTIAKERTGLSLTLRGGTNGPFLPVGDESGRAFLYKMVAVAVEEFNRRFRGLE
ncbi:hypothetical protein BN1723_016595, partial [Verticillium longisporum]